MRNNSRFSVSFLEFFLTLLKTIDIFLLLTTQSGFTFLSETGLMSKIESLLLLKKVMTNIKKKKLKNTHHCKINTFITPFGI
jgi:hypothetical protein